MSKKRVAIYARTGSSMEAGFAQRMKLRRFAEMQPDWEIVSTTEDMMISCDSCQRLGLLRLISEAAESKIDIVLAQSPARFYRDANKTEDVLRQFRERGASVVFARDKPWSGNSLSAP